MQTMVYFKTAKQKLWIVNSLVDGEISTRIIELSNKFFLDHNKGYSIYIN